MQPEQAPRGMALEMIETARLVLRLPQPEDARALLGFVSDDEVMSRLADKPGGIEKAEEVVRRWIARWERNGVGQFVVERNAAPIGRVGLVVWDRRTWETSSYDLAGEHAQEELGWGLVREAWGCGYATEAAQAVRVWATESGIRRLVSLIATDNRRSQRVAEKLGAHPTEEIQSEFGATQVWTYPSP